MKSYSVGTLFRGTACVVSLMASFALGGEVMKILFYGTDVIGGFSDQNSAENYLPSKYLKFSLVDKKVIGSSINIEGDLTNESLSEEKCIFLPVDAKGPFTAAIELSDKIKQIEDPATFVLGQPLPPDPISVTIPSKGKIRFRTSIPLSGYEIKGSPMVQINWTLHYSNEPKPKGRISVQLPAKQ